MQKYSSGTYEITSAYGTEVRAFIPDTLPPRRKLDIGPLQRLLDSALVAIGKLDTISDLLPDATLYLTMYMRKESVQSSQIEGTVSTLSDVLLFELGQSNQPKSSDDLIEVINYATALEHAFKRMRDDNFPLSNRLIKEVHKQLLQSGRGNKKTPGEFRRSQNWIGGSRPDNSHFVPPPAHIVNQCMSDLEKFIHMDNFEYSGLIKTGLTHVQFETIHPFLDGNGRVGRLLIALQLHHERLLSERMLYVSHYINQHREEYYKRLNDVRSEGRWEDWLEFFLNAVLETSSDAIFTARRLAELFQRDENTIRNSGGHRGSAIQVHQAFRRLPFLTIQRIADFTGLTLPAVANGIKTLEKLNIVNEYTGKKRYRIYLYNEFLAILEGDLTD